MRKIIAWMIGIVVFTVLPAYPAMRLPRNRAVILPVGPFVDYQDGVTPETAMTVTNITCELVRRSDAGGAGANPTLVINTTLTASGGSNDMVLVAGSTVGTYGLELTAAQLTTVGHYRLTLSDPDVMCPWFTDIIVEPNNVYDSDVSGTDVKQVDTTQILGTTLTEDVAGYLAAAFKKFFNVAAPVLTTEATVLTTTTVVDGTATWDDLGECLLAWMVGKATLTDNGTTNTLAFYKQNGSTVQFNVTSDLSTGARSSGGTIDP